MVLNCFKCKAEVVFDAEHIGRNGKKIPLDPTTKQPHDCPMREKPLTGSVAGKQQSPDEDKNDHGNESFDGIRLQHPENIGKATIEYVDHTLKGASKVKIFYAAETEQLEIDYDKFLFNNQGKIKTQGAQFQMENGQFAIALYYEEVAK